MVNARKQSPAERVRRKRLALAALEQRERSPAPEAGYDGGDPQTPGAAAYDGEDAQTPDSQAPGPAGFIDASPSPADDPPPQSQPPTKLELVLDAAVTPGADLEPDEAEPPAPESGGVQQSIAPVAGVADAPARLKRGIALLAVVAAVAGSAIGVKIMRSKPAQTARPAETSALQEQAPEPQPSSAALPTSQPSAPLATSEPTAVPAVNERTASAAALRDQALELLKKYKNPEAMEKASAALEADPSDAMPYLVLGSALQDAGHWKEAYHAYELCTKNATKGMVSECRAMLHAR
jgi:hypothetical protein